MSLQSRQPGRPHPIWRRPEAVSTHCPRTLNHYDRLEPWTAQSSASGARDGQLMTYLVEVEDQIQLTHIAKEGIQHLHEEMDGFKIGQLIVICVYTGTEEQSCIAAIDNLGGIPELHKVGLMLLVSWSDESVNLFQTVRLMYTELLQHGYRTSPLSLTFSSSWGSQQQRSISRGLAGRQAYMIWCIPFC
jgi:hypothetical protein